MKCKCGSRIFGEMIARVKDEDHPSGPTMTVSISYRCAACDRILSIIGMRSTRMEQFVRRWVFVPGEEVEANRANFRRLLAQAEKEFAAEGSKDHESPT